MKTTKELESIAAQLAARVREFSPQSNARWLMSVCPDSLDWYRLLYILAAAVPVDRPWRELTAWADGLHEQPVPDPEPTDDVDEIAVERAMHGDPVRLRRDEKAAVVDRLTAKGRTAKAIAELLRTTIRSVQRRRTAARRTSTTPTAIEK